ncbi:Small proline-rich 2 domain [Mollivirus sibericum]|uniref:Small proline-rich 2 domain n=1 Tax=Mollivirus sibericum TaxID=1678078 RepID=UPI0006B2EC78|nr:Small proline-rich 2 domain [Mollivirus sibericum]ALD62096.1 Small proline-rich 2 domain [Mollivirus sibericum]
MASSRSNVLGMSGVNQQLSSGKRSSYLFGRSASASTGRAHSTAQGTLLGLNSWSASASGSRLPLDLDGDALYDASATGHFSYPREHGTIALDGRKQLASQGFDDDDEQWAPQDAVDPQVAPPQDEDDSESIALYDGASISDESTSLDNIIRAVEKQINQGKSQESDDSDNADKEEPQSNAKAKDSRRVSFQAKSDTSAVTSFDVDTDEDKQPRGKGGRRTKPVKRATRSHGPSKRQGSDSWSDNSSGFTMSSFDFSAASSDSPMSSFESGFGKKARGRRPSCSDDDDSTDQSAITSFSSLTDITSASDTSFAKVFCDDERGHQKHKHNHRAEADDHTRWGRDHSFVRKHGDCKECDHRHKSHCGCKRCKVIVIHAPCPPEPCRAPHAKAVHCKKPCEPEPCKEPCDRPVKCKKPCAPEPCHPPKECCVDIREPCPPKCDVKVCKPAKPECHIPEPCAPRCDVKVHKPAKPCEPECSVMVCEPAKCHVKIKKCEKPAKHQSIRCDAVCPSSDDDDDDECQDRKHRHHGNHHQGQHRGPSLLRYGSSMTPYGHSHRHDDDNGSFRSDSDTSDIDLHGLSMETNRRMDSERSSASSASMGSYVYG